MFHALFTRIPDLELGGEPELMHSMSFNGVKSMPCSCTPTRSPAHVVRSRCRDACDCVSMSAEARIAPMGRAD